MFTLPVRERVYIRSYVRRQKQFVIRRTKPNGTSYIRKKNSFELTLQRSLKNFLSFLVNSKYNDSLLAPRNEHIRKQFEAIVNRMCSLQNFIIKGFSVFLIFGYLLLFSFLISCVKFHLMEDFYYKFKKSFIDFAGECIAIYFLIPHLSFN